MGARCHIRTGHSYLRQSSRCGRVIHSVLRSLNGQKGECHGQIEVSEGINSDHKLKNSCLVPMPTESLLNRGAHSEGGYNN